MKTAQFYRGKIDGVQKHFESQGINQMLPAATLDALKDYDEIGDYPQFFRKEKVLVRTIITAASNTDGRRGGIINRTIMRKWDQGFTQDEAPYVFDLESFIAEILAGKRRLKMPPLPHLPEGDFGFIETPVLEWEVQP